MGLTIVEHVGLTDVGRQREANEDNFVVASPLFAVADGMGGAQAGEVASRIAAETFESLSTDPALTPEQRLAEGVRDANRQIYEIAQSDESRRGMGTTLTAALLDDNAVSLAHVGDSRAYRLRDGDLSQLTHDHSLVAELERSGQLTPEAAENHPQRSIITRALGPEPDVQVDSHTHAARAGDIYLLCSDGLTGMVGDAAIAGILRNSASLDAAARELVKSANTAGGRDNITVVVFRADDTDAESDTATDTAVAPPADPPEETIHQGVTADDIRSAVAEQERAAPASPATAPEVAPKAAAASRRVVPGPARRRSPFRRALAPVALLAVLAAVGWGTYSAARSVWFLGTNEAGLVTLYRGLPYDLPVGIELYSRQYESSVPARAIPRSRRDNVLDHKWRGRDDAEDLLRQLERGTLDPGSAE